MEQNIIDEIEKYYVLKNKYETKILNTKMTIYKNTTLSLLEKRSELKKIRSICVNCKRPVGTIFKTIPNEEMDTRSLIARCGDTKEPCDLNINIQLSHYNNLHKLLYETKTNINNIKKNIILDKNNTIFSYNDSVQNIESFNENKKELNIELDIYEIYYNEYDNNITKSVSKKKITSLKNDILESIQKIKKNMAEFKTTNDSTYINNVIDIYSNVFYNNNEDELQDNNKSKLEELNSLLYSSRYVLENNLIKNKYDIKDLYINNYSEDKIISNIHVMNKKPPKKIKKIKQTPSQVILSQENIQLEDIEKLN
jgi:hypothetical protein